jgi:hypothetical protein
MGNCCSHAQLCASRIQSADTTTQDPASAAVALWQSHSSEFGTKSVTSVTPYSSILWWSIFCCSAKRFTSGSA